MADDLSGDDLRGRLTGVQLTLVGLAVGYFFQGAPSAWLFGVLLVVVGTVFFVAST